MAAESPLADTIGAAVRRLRLSHGWTQAQFAEKVRISLNYVGAIETGTRVPSIEMLVQLAAALGTTPNRLLGVETDAAGERWVQEGAELLRAMDPEIRKLAVGVLQQIALIAQSPRNPTVPPPSSAQPSGAQPIGAPPPEPPPPSSRRGR